MNHRYSNKNEAIQLNRRGESFFDEGLYEEAFAEFSRAIEMDPDMADFHNNLGVCYWHMGEPVKALESLQKTLEIDPSSDDARQNVDEVLRQIDMAGGAGFVANGCQPIENVDKKGVIAGQDAKPTVRVLHQMARSGGTVLSKCLGCMEDVILLSEIHPMGMRWFDPIHQDHKWYNPLMQAHHWFQLFTPADMDQFAKKGDIVFQDAISFISDKCEQQNKTLLIRDWNHLDFTGTPFISKPSYRLLTFEVLCGRFDVINTGTVRHPIDQWLSLRTLDRLNGKITLNAFLKGYLAFAEYCRDIGFIRYEDFVKSPEVEMKNLCDRLSVDYDPAFIQKWFEYNTITGDINSERGYKREIKPVSRRKAEDGLIEQFERNIDYQRAIEILGYNHPG